MLKSSLRSNSTATLSLRGLQANTDYNITIISGSYQYFVDTSYNQVVTDNATVGGMLGSRSESGFWKHRCFNVTSSTSGMASLRFGSTNVGPIYQSSYDLIFHDAALDAVDGSGGHNYGQQRPPQGAHFLSWLINGILVQQKAQNLTYLAEEDYLFNAQVSESAIRTWSIIGPFNEPNYSYSKFGPEESLNLETKYPSGFSERTEDLYWHNVTLNDTALPLVNFRDILGISNNEMEHGVSFAVTKIRTVNGTGLSNVSLHYSTSQAASVYINGELKGSKYVSTGVQRVDAMIHLNSITSDWTTILIRSQCFWGSEWALHARLYHNGLPLPPSLLENGT
eukprot:m.14944 g.14944  ORF g.14944 m.14944 type:complete len:338 (+) comp5256_c0_seq1:3-1016(+)